ETAQGYLTQHLIADPPLLREVSPDRKWPTEADDLIQRMMAKSKDERFMDCGEILDVLRGGLSQEIIRGASAGAAPAPQELAPVAVAVAPPVTQRLDKGAWGVKGILGRLMGKGK
ncbi:hypothetical protein HY251_01785, partial [bacterium]|nr:hypothetical protein [bacterium]